MVDWTLYRTFLEVLRTGGQSQAARHLGLTQPTVRRHVEALERELGRTLFTRSSSGLAPNTLALSLRSAAEAIEAQAAAIERRATASDELMGIVRISASRVVAAEVLPPMLRDLRSRESGLRFEIDDSNDQRDLLQREADIAVRMVRPSQLDLVQRHVGDVALGLFAHRSWIDAHGVPATAGNVAGLGALLGFDRDPTQARMWGEHLPNLKSQAFALRCDNELTVLSALRAGMGVGVSQLPIAACDPDLVRVVPDWAASLGVWVVVHRDLRSEPRVSCVFEHLCEKLAMYVRH
ncbi:LysR family transcriptional regulator [Rhizobiaceae bacterium]|nr:LysR family transcriptional regulator [Rhizobiaceae bacterium]